VPPLHLNGHLVSDDPGDADVGHALRRMTRADDVLTLARPPAAFLQATGSPAHGFLLNAYDDAAGASRATSERLDTASVTAVLSRFLRGDARWGDRLPWSTEPRPWPPAWRSLTVGGIALAVFLGAFVAAMTAAHLGGAAARPSRDDWLRGLGALVVIAAYIAWLDCFFRVLRPRAARWLGARMGTRVAESAQPVDAGTWTATGGRLGARLGVYLADIALLLAGVVLPLAVPAVAAFRILGP
jgi:hypothetical protein